MEGKYMSTDQVITNKVATVQELAQLAIKNTYDKHDSVGKVYNKGTEEIKIGGHYPELELVRIAPENDHGYQGYIYKNRETNEYYLVHEGSAMPGFNSETAKVRRLGFNPTSFLIINYQ